MYTEEQKEKRQDGLPLSSFRWAILGLTFAGGLCQNLLWLSTVPLVLAVERDLSLSAAQVALWVNIPVTCAVFLCIPIGVTVDRWGGKPAGRLGVLALAVGAMARGFSHSYEILLLASIVFGVGYMAFFVSQTKLLAVWFPSHQIGSATGIFLTGTGAGSALGLSMVQPIFGNAWRLCFLVLGWFGIAIAVSWWFLAREPARILESGRLGAGPREIRSLFQLALKTRVIWLLVVVFFCYIAGFTSWFTFGFPFLVRFRGMSEDSAAMVLTLTMLGYTLAATLMPSLSDRVGRRKPFFLCFGALALFLFVALSLWSSSAFVWPAAVLIGMCFGTINPLVFVVAAEARELGPGLMGASLGTIISLGSLAGFLVPLVLGKFLGSLGSATEHGFQLVWLTTAAWAGGILVFGLLLKETGPVSQTALARADAG